MPGHKLARGHSFFEIIEDAYRVFDVPKPTSIEVCDCCMYPEIYADFFNPPIRDLSFEYVRDWYHAAYQPPGIAKATWAYLLPRILEILAAGEHVSDIAIEVSLNRFDTGNPANWTSQQWAILDHFQRLYLARMIAGEIDGTREARHDRLDDVLCMFRLAGWPLESLLEQVASTPGVTLAQRLWNDWCNHHAPGRESVWITAFWEGTDNSTVFAFYTSSDLLDRMETLALSDEIDPQIARQASAVAQVITQSRN